MIRIKCKHIVKPAEETWKGTLPLSELDQIAIITLASHLYFYDKPKDEEWVNPSENKIINTLIDSLSHVLVPFYPLAGRLRWLGQGGRLKLECNGLGTQLIEAESSMKFADFGDFYSCTHKFHDLLPEIDYFGTPLKDLPVMAVQVTRFSCGGLSVGISMSHVVVDGKSAFHFTEEWARLARGELLKEIPFLDRRVRLAKDDDEDNNVEVVEGANLNYFNELRLRQIEEGKLELEKVVPTFVHITKDTIERLKDIANHNNTGRPYSRFEVITAHVWRCMSKARNLNNEDTTTLIACVDSRGRMHPPLPPRYFGNGIVDNEVSVSAGELITKPLSYACSKIREATSGVTNEHVLETIEFYKTQKNLNKYQFIDDRGKIQGPSYGKNNMLVMSWLNLMGRSIDFGWGKEIHMGPPVVHCCDGDVMITPYKNDGSVVVGVALHNKQKFQEYMSHPIVMDSEP